MLKFFGIFLEVIVWWIICRCLGLIYLVYVYLKDVVSKDFNEIDVSFFKKDCFVYVFFM